MNSHNSPPRREGDLGEQLLKEIAEAHGLEAAEHFRHWLRWEIGAYLFRPPIGHAPLPSLDELDDAIRHALPEVLRHLARQRSQQESLQPGGQRGGLGRCQREGGSPSRPADWPF